MASRRPSCLLCGKSEENSVTGPLATKDGITAHQNCLLYASGIYCKDSPEYDDLFGFSVEDVKQEGRRGKKLRCHSCKHRGATAGCEVKRCTRSYHYPCAVHSNADFIENQSNGLFQLFCEQHRQKANGSAQNDGATNQGEGSKARQDVMSTARQDVMSTAGSTRKRKFPGSDKEDLIPPVSDEEDNTQLTGPERKTERGAATDVTQQCTNMSTSGLDGDDTDIESDGASESLLPNVSFVDDGEPVSPLEAPAPAPAPVSDAPAPVSDAPGDPGAPGEGQAEAFWRSCTQAGCTHAIFTRLSADLSGLAQRIQAQEPSPDDCAVALRVLQAFGNSEEIISELEEEFEADQRRLRQRREALRTARGALRPDQQTQKERPPSPVSSVTSMTSDGSMETPLNFKEQEKVTEPETRPAERPANV